MYIHITDITDVSVDLEKENLYNKHGAHQLNAISTQCDDGAPDDRANKCSLSNSGRRRMLSVQNTMTGVQCKYSRTYVRSYKVIVRKSHMYLSLYILCMAINHGPEWWLHATPSCYFSINTMSLSCEQYINR